MAWSGGNFTRTNGIHSGSDVWAQDKAALAKILASRHDTHDEDLADGVNNCLTKDGQNAPTADLPMGSFLHTGVGSATARTNYPSAGQVQDGAIIYGGTSGGSANAQTISLTPAITAYVAGQIFSFIAGFTNTGNVTLNVNGVGAKNIQHALGFTPVGGEILVGKVITVVYDGTSFRIISPTTPVIDRVTATTTASNTTTETALYSFTVPANTIPKFRALRLTLFGDLLNTTGGVALCTFRFKLGGSTIFTDTNASISTGCNRGVWRASWDIEALDASVQRHALGWKYTTVTADTGALTDFLIDRMAGYTNGAADSTTTNVIAMTVQMASASANFEMRSLGGVLEIL